MSTALKVSVRDLKGPTGKQCRRKGQIPAVFYGRGIPNEHFLIPVKDLSKVLHSDEHIVELQIDGKRQELALVQELQKNYLTGTPIHVSFLKVRKGERTWMTVEIELEGDAPGVKDGGDLIHNLREIEIECTPENAPDRIHVDISKLGKGDSIRVRDIQFPAGVKVSDKDLDLDVAAIHEHKEEVVEAQLEAPKTEVIGKPDEAAAPAAGAPAAKKPETGGK